MAESLFDDMSINRQCKALAIGQGVCIFNSLAEFFLWLAMLFYHIFYFGIILTSSNMLPL